MLSTTCIVIIVVSVLLILWVRNSSKEGFDAHKYQPYWSDFEPHYLDYVPGMLSEEEVRDNRSCPPCYLYDEKRNVYVPWYLAYPPCPPGLRYATNYGKCVNSWF